MIHSLQKNGYEFEVISDNCDPNYVQYLLDQKFIVRPNLPQQPSNFSPIRQSESPNRFFVNKHNHADSPVPITQAQDVGRASSPIHSNQDKGEDVQQNAASELVQQFSPDAPTDSNIERGESSTKRSRNN